MQHHQPDCQWRLITTAECSYRATHQYCPHPEHACTCTRAPKPQHHPAVQHLLDQFQWEHLPLTLQAVVMPIAAIAEVMAETLGSGPELSTGLRKLLEAKDCLVRQKVIDLREANEPPPVNSPQAYLTKPS